MTKHRHLLISLLLLLTIFLATSVGAQEPDPTDPPSQPEIPVTPPGGRWLFRSEEAVSFNANGGRVIETYPSSYHFEANTPVDLKILLYADDFIHLAPNTYPDQALQGLGLSYTAHYDGDYPGFETSLTGQEWDIIIFANENISPPTTTFDMLDAYVQEGGRLLIHSWLVSNGHTLWSSLDITHISDVLSPPAPVYWWNAAHPIFTAPNQVPEFTNLSEPCNCTYGQRVDWPSSALAIGGYTEDIMVNEAALVVGNDNRTVFRGFLDLQNEADENNNNLPDSMELWQNLIQFAQPPLNYVAVDSSGANVYFLDESLNRIRSFPTGATNPNGIATDGRLIFTGHFQSQEVVAYNFRGEEQFRWNGTLSGLQGMELVGDELAINRSSAIDFFEPLTGTFIRTTPTTSGAVEGIAYDGENLWLLDNDLIAVDPITGAVVKSVPNAAEGICSFNGTGLTTDGPGELTIGCSNGSWFTISSADGTVLDAGENGVGMFGLKIVPPRKVFLPMLVKD